MIGYSDIKLDDPVEIKRNNAPPNSPSTLQGFVSFLGAVTFADGYDWVGVRLTGDSIGHGMNDGAVRGVRYFNNCGQGGGLFVRLHAITRMSLVCKETKREKMKRGESDGVQLAFHRFRAARPSTSTGKRLHLNHLELQRLSEFSFLNSKFLKNAAELLQDSPNTNSVINKMQKMIDVLTKCVGQIDKKNTLLQTRVEELNIERTRLEETLEVVNIRAEKVQEEVESFSLKLKEVEERKLTSKRTVSIPNVPFASITALTPTVNAKATTMATTRKMMERAARPITQTPQTLPPHHHPIGTSTIEQSYTTESKSTTTASANNISSAPNPLVEIDPKLTLVPTVATAFTSPLVVESQTTGVEPAAKNRIGDAAQTSPSASLGAATSIRSSTPPTKIIEKAKATIFEPSLMGNVFLRDDDETGLRSLHFNNEIGSYLSYEHDRYSNSKMDDGITKWPSRIFFIEPSYNSNERTFSGLIDFEGSLADGVVSHMYEIVFDTQFLCVLSGKIIRKRVDKEDQIETFGQDCAYTNSNLVGKVNMQTLKRLEKEGATERNMRPIFKDPRKYHRCVVIEDFVDWMT